MTMYHPSLVLRGEPAGAHHTRSHTYAHAGLIVRNHICTTAFNCRRLAENNKQTRSVLDREADTGSTIHGQMEAAQMKVNYRPLLCLLTALMEFALTRRIKKKDLQQKWVVFKLARDTRGLWRAGKPATNRNYGDM